MNNWKIKSKEVKSKDRRSEGVYDFFHNPIDLPFLLQGNVIFFKVEALGLQLLLSIDLFFSSSCLLTMKKKEEKRRKKKEKRKKKKKKN